MRRRRPHPSTSSCPRATWPSPRPSLPARARKKSISPSTTTRNWKRKLPPSNCTPSQRRLFSWNLTRNRAAYPWYSPWYAASLAARTGTSSNRWINPGAGRAPSSEPQHGLADREIAQHLFHHRVGIQLLPQGDVFRFVQRHSGEYQAGLADRPLLVVHDIGRLGPAFLVGDEGNHPRHRLRHAAAVGQLPGPEVVFGGAQGLHHNRHGIQIEKRVSVGLGARQFPREAAFRALLIGNQHRPV